MLTLHPSLAGRSLVDVLRTGGVVGAGGGGFPTWAKFANDVVAQRPILVVNAQESEPGYFIDKWLHAHRASALLDVLQHLQQTLSLAKVVVAAKQKDRAWFTTMEQLAGVDVDGARVLDCTGRNRHVLKDQPEPLLFAYTDDRYAYGMETALLLIVAQQKIPQGERPGQHGYIVVNSETLFTIHELLTQGQPVIDTFVHVYGAGPRHTFRHVPVGTPVGHVLADADVPLADIDARGFVVVDGGPGWFTRIDPHSAVITKRTNAILVLDPAVVDVNKTDVFATATKAGYPRADVPPTLSPSYLSSGMVRVPLIDNPKLKGVVPAEPIVQVGDVVARGQAIAVAPAGALAVDTHASIAGRITAVGPDGIGIEA
jgi:electron transport complex protein RnfC